MKSIVILCSFFFAAAIAAGGHQASSSSGSEPRVAIDNNKPDIEYLRELFQHYTQNTGGVLTAKSAQDFVRSEKGKVATHKEALESVRKMAKNEDATHATESQFLDYMMELHNSG